MRKPTESSGTGIACDPFSMVLVSASIAVFDADGRLISRTERFSREFPDANIPKLSWAVSGLLRGERERQSIRLGDHRVDLQRLRGDVASVVVSAYRWPDLFQRLSPRQQEIAQLAVDGATAVEIAEILDISVHTVRQHIKEVYRRLEVGNRAELVQLLAAS